MSRRVIQLTHSLFALGASTIVPSRFFAQAVAVKTLATPQAELTEPFTAVTSVRELGDGRVLIVDGREKTLQLGDFRTQQLVKVGREGAGPAEFASVGRMYALANDVTVMNDFANDRFFVIAGGAKNLSTRRFDTGVYGIGADLVSIDEAGRMYMNVRPPGSKEEGGTQTLVRYNAETKHADTITTVMRPSGVRSGAAMIGNGMLKMFTNLPLAPEDAVAIGHDGRIAVVRVGDYHVEWYAVGAPPIIGKPVAYEPVRITAAEKKAYLEKQVRPGAFIVRNPGGTGKANPIGSGGSGLPKSAMSSEALDDRGMEWPVRKPPFLANAAWVDREGNLWVSRAQTYDVLTPRYDVFDASARLIMQVVLPKNTQLAGFGRGTVYVSRMDDDELRYLQRYASPVGR